MRLPKFLSLAQTGLCLLGLLALTTAAAQAAPVAETGAWHMPRDVSHEGHRIDWLINITGVFVTIMFVIMCIWMAISYLKHDEKHEADPDDGSARGHVITALVVSALIFLVVDGNLFYHSVKDLQEVFWNSDEAEETTGAVRIEINAHQWAWDARYAGQDGQFNTADDIVTLNDIRVPVDAPVIMQLTSTDVIHSLYLPNLRQKIDAVPGTVTRLWFTAKDSGEFDIACAQHCGVAHYLMKGQLTILSREAFDAWAKQASDIGRLSHDPDDAGAHWGWTWKRT